MTATVNTVVNKDTQILGKTKKINFIKKYPYWVYIVLGFGVVGLIIAITTTALVSSVYWSYSNYYYNVLNTNNQFVNLIGKELGPNDFWKLIVINPKIFNPSFYQNSIVGTTLFEKFSNWCNSRGVATFLDEEQFKAFSYFFSTLPLNPNEIVFNQEIANKLWNPCANAYYITTCVFWIVSVITLSIILFNWWAYVVKQIKENQLPKAERIAAKKAKKEARLLEKERREKIKQLKERNLATQNKNISTSKLINVNDENESFNTFQQSIVNYNETSKTNGFINLQKQEVNDDKKIISKQYEMLKNDLSSREV